MKKLFCFIIFAALLKANLYPNPFDDIKFGHYTVGFRVRDNIDSSGASRQIKIYTWYPAQSVQTEKYTKPNIYK